MGVQSAATLVRPLFFFSRGGKKSALPLGPFRSTPVEDHADSEIADSEIADYESVGCAFVTRSEVHSLRSRALDRADSSNTGSHASAGPSSG